MRSLLWYIIFLSALPVFCQKKPAKAERKGQRLEKRFAAQRYFTTAYGVLYNFSQDTRMEQSTYQGPGASISLGYTRYAAKGDHLLTGLMGSFALLEAAHGEGSVYNPRFEINYTYLRRLKSSPWNLKLGGAFMNMVNLRISPELSNSGFNWDGVASLAIAGEVGRSFVLLKKDSDLRFLLQVPLFSYINRLPTYALSSDGTENYFVPLTRFTRVHSELSLSRKIGRTSDNPIRLAYGWDYYGFSELDVHTLRIANHSLSCTFFLKL